MRRLIGPEAPSRDIQEVFLSDEVKAKPQKCNMCLERLEVGDLTICVYSCPIRALDFRPLAELVDMYGDKHNWKIFLYTP
ncbi:MAG: hypothetical protein JSV02_05500 [Dehalococcoidia bacterium]|nr:MAG: hypothetical protein JSV02_05500 [Dehalococcoidia bacterium]